MKTRTATPYWHFLKPIFRRYGLRLNGPPYETKMKELIKKWLKAQNVELVTRQGLNIDVVDYEFPWKGCHIGLEIKGHCRGTHNLTKMMDQIKRYLDHVELLVILVHSHGLKTQLERILSVSPKTLQTRVLLFKLLEIDKIFPQLENQIEKLGY